MKSALCGFFLAAWSLQLVAQEPLAAQQPPASQKLLNTQASSAGRPPLTTQQPPTAQPSPQSQKYWQQQVNYTIDVTLNDKDRTLDGFLKMQYSNHSPDTLTFIWIHCWPNAYKNDRTAFSEQLLGNGRTDFYFSDPEQRGYINRLDFRVDGVVAELEDHPQYIDIIKVVLPTPLPPRGQVTITTPFHEKLPFNFSRGGHRNGAFQVTQWYPKPAVYDQKGWHPIPYLDQGEFYSEYGNFDVRITLPQAYVVAATGILQDSSTTRQSHPSPLTTLHYRQDNIHDFAWFADKHYLVDHDTLLLKSGRVIDCYAYYTPGAKPVWKNSIQYIKDAVRFRSSLIGEYPFNVVSAAEISMGSPGGMEYPTITGITPQKTGRSLDMVIEHEVGHNWFYAVLGTNERRYPWMDEGINTYYDNRYESLKYNTRGRTWPHDPPSPHPGPHAPPDNSWLAKKIPDNPALLFINTLAKEKRDQPISTPSQDFTETNYYLIAYEKTALWMKQLEDTLGPGLFDTCMQEYFRSWQFRHPGPDDFRAVMENCSHRDLSGQFALLDTKGAIPPLPEHRKIQPTFLFSGRNTGRISYINILPAAGYNMYDGFMIGALIHNYDLPPNKFQFFAAPLYATISKQMNGIGGLSYSWYPDDPSRFRKVSIGVTGSRFSTLSANDSSGNKLFGGFYKVVPAIRLDFSKPSARSTVQKWIEWKTYLIGENQLNNYVLKTSDSNYYPTRGNYAFRYLNQLSFRIEDSRVLYPYDALLQFQQGSQFYRINLTGNYFFNYAQGGGMNLRFFAAKFGYIGGGSTSSYDLTVFQPKLTAVRGDEDYTYSNYFIGRNEYTGFASQQIMMRDGGLKIRTDLFQGLQGRSANWVSSLNLTSSLPYAIIPRWLPLKLFLDVGTYAEAWQDNPPTSRFLYVGGLQLSLLKNMINIYAPLFYSSDFSNQLKTVPEENTFWKKISFSIDIQNFDIHKIAHNLPI